MSSLQLLQNKHGCHLRRLMIFILPDSERSELNCVYVCVSLCLCVSLLLCVCVCVCVCVSLCVCVCVCVCFCLCVCVSGKFLVIPKKILSFFTFFFLSVCLVFLVWNLPPIHCKCIGLLLHMMTLSGTHTHKTHRQKSSGRGMVPSQRPLHDNTQYSQQIHTHTPLGFEPAVRTGERPQSHALDRETTGIGTLLLNPLNPVLNPICHLLALLGAHHIVHISRIRVKGHFKGHYKEHYNPLNAELNSICHLLALLGAHHIFHVSRIRVNYSY